MSLATATKRSMAEEWQRFDVDSGRFSVVALGVDLKNSLCRAENSSALLSGLYGDLNDPAVFSKVRSTLPLVGRVDAVACDLHPDLHASRLAGTLSERVGVPLIPVQHHHAHIAAVMAEHGLKKAIGLALDGFGHGTDGTAWGGECLVVEAGGFERVSHLKPVAMPGGDAASREPWRMAVAWLGDAKIAQELFPDRPVTTMQQLCESPGTTKTSSAGRLFDAASAIILGYEIQGFEGEAAIQLEKYAAAAPSACKLDREPLQMIRQLAEAVMDGADKPSLALGFHQALADHFVAMACAAAKESGMQNVVLAGGCFMNRLLRERIATALGRAGLKVFAGKRLPHGDVAVALGQAWVTLEVLKRGSI